jgi:hypothetical protein
MLKDILKSNLLKKNQISFWKKSIIFPDQLDKQFKALTLFLSRFKYQAFSPSFLLQRKNKTLFIDDIEDDVKKSLLMSEVSFR